MKKHSGINFYLSYRFLIAIVGFFGYCIQYMQKIDLGIAIVCMVNHTALDKPKIVAILDNSTSLNNHENQTQQSSCPVHQFHRESHLDGSFLWNKELQGFILSSYFYGYILTQIIGGIFAAKFGAKYLLMFGMFIGSLMTLLIPLVSNLSFIALIVCRILTGIGHSFFMPGMSGLWVNWAPPDERSRLIGMSHAGGMIGNIIALLTGGYLCMNGFAGGWPSIFYIFGIIGILWVIITGILISNTPNENKFICHSEKDYINIMTQHVKLKRKLNIPWKNIIKSKACWSIFASHFCNNWGIYLFITQLPSYMKEVLRFDIKSNGYMSSLPFLACWLFINASSLLADVIIKSEKISRQNVRKIFNGIGLIFPVVTIFALAFVTCNYPYIGVALITIGFAFMGFSLGGGYYVNINEIAGSFSSVVFGISNSIATIPGIIAPYITGVITKNQSQKEWQIVFIMCSIIYLLGFLVYSIFSSSDLEPWAKQLDTENEGDVTPKQYDNPAGSFEFVKKE